MTLIGAEAVSYVRCCHILVVIIVSLTTSSVVRQSEAQTNSIGALTNTIASNSKSALKESLKMFNRYNYGVSERSKDNTLVVAKLTRGVQPNDKVGLALIMEDFDKATKMVPTKPNPTAGLVNRYQFIQLDQVVDNFFSFASDVKHPPNQDELSAALRKYQTEEDKSLMASLKRRVHNCIATTEEYANVVVRYQRWYKLHTKLEELDDSVGGFIGVVLGEFSHACAEIREETSSSMSGAPLSKQLAYEKHIKGDSDFVLDALKRTIERLEEKLHEEDYRNLLGPKTDLLLTPSRSVNDDLMLDKFASFKATVIKEAKNLIISEARHMAKAALLGLVASFVSGRMQPSEGFMLYVGKLFTYMGVSSVSLTVESLRDERTRTALTLLNIFNPLPNLTSLLKNSVG